MGWTGRDRDIAISTSGCCKGTSCPGDIMGAKLSKKKKGYDVSDPKEKKDEEAISITAAKSEAQESEQAASSSVAEDQAKTEAVAATSAEAAGEVAAVSQEVTSSEAPVIEAKEEELNVAQVEAVVAKEPATQGPPPEPKTEVPSVEPEPEAKPEVSLPAKDDTALKKAEETLAANTVVNLEPPVVPEAECQMIQEAVSVVTAAAPVTECLPDNNSTGPITEASCPAASPPDSGITVQPAEAADKPVSISKQELTKKSEIAVQPEQATSKSDCTFQTKEGTTEKVAAAVQESKSKPANAAHAEESTIKTLEMSTTHDSTSKAESAAHLEESTVKTQEVAATQESTSKPESVVQLEESTVKTQEVAAKLESTSKPESVIQPEESAVKTQEVAAKLESTSKPGNVVQTEESTMETLEVAATQEPTTKPESVIQPEESTVETQEVAATQESTNEPATAVQSEQSVIKTMDVVSVLESCAEPETVDQPEDAVIDTAAVVTVQETFAKVSKTPESVTDLIQEHEMQTITPEPTKTEVPPHVLEKSPAATMTQVKMVDCTETQAETEVRVEPTESSTVSEEHTKATPSLQAEVPSIAPSSAEAGVTEVPEIVISESHSTNEFPRDEVEGTVVEVEPAAELKKVEDTIPEGAPETSKPEPVTPSPPSAEVQVSLNSFAANDVTAGNSAQDNKADLENGDSKTTSSTDMKERPPSPELNGEPQMSEVLLEKSAKSQKEECVNGITVPDVSPKEQQVMNDCELKKDLIGDAELPETMSEMAEAINASVNQDVDLI
ncbi:titin homolog isoform X1 [Arapaima gigas]